MSLHFLTKGLPFSIVKHASRNPSDKGRVPFQKQVMVAKLVFGYPKLSKSDAYALQFRSGLELALQLLNSRFGESGGAGLLPMSLVL